MSMKKSYVSIVKTDCYSYPKADTLFRPSTAYPEYPFDELSGEENRVYDAVRESLHLLGLDAEHFGKKDWNPLGEMIKPEDRVLIKPNLVMDVNFNKSGGEECLYTHPAVTAAVIDYALIALKGSGTLVVGDAPMQECDFENLAAKSGYDKLIHYYRDKGIGIQFLDLRGLKAKVKNGVHHPEIDTTVSGKIVDLGKCSEFSRLSPEALERLRVTNFDPRLMSTYHNAESHKYYVSDYVLDADVIIDLPKPKSHRKAGVTASLKNFVGINVRKESLPHHTKGENEHGGSGDEYLTKNPIHNLRSSLYDIKNVCVAEGRYTMALFLRWCIRACNLVMRLFKEKIKEGSWYGNNTISRTITDLNKIVNYADKNGILHDDKVRKIFIVADMIISGEREGPVSPSPKNVGIIAAGSNLVCFDEAITTLMGFDIEKIPTLKCVRSISDCHKLAEADERPALVSNDQRYNGKSIEELNRDDLLDFIPASGWIGHIELEKNK